MAPISSSFLEHRHEQAASAHRRAPRWRRPRVAFKVGGLHAISSMWTTVSSRQRWASRPFGPGRNGSRRRIFGIAGRHVVQCDAAKRISFAEATECRTWPRRCASHSPTSPGTPARVRRRAGMTLSTSRGRGLLLQRFGRARRCAAASLEQPHVLDGDHRLVGEDSEPARSACR